MPPKRPQIQRHRVGKPTGSWSSSESDASDTEQTPAIAPPPKVPSAGKIASVGSLKQVDLDARRRAAQDQEDRRVAAQKLAQRAAEEGFVTEEEEESDDGEEGSGEEEDSSDEEEEEESSEDERPRRLVRPKFIPKSQRNGNSKDKEAEEAKRLAEDEKRKQAEQDAMVEEEIRRRSEAQKKGKSYWDDAMDSEEDVDTEDDVDPAAEEAAWRVRELRRVKRERDAIEQREKEREEVERRRNLSEAERQAEDAAFLAKQKEEKEAKGKMTFMGKYFHKGAFYRDGDDAARLAERDIMGGRFQDDYDRSLMPKALQIRDATKIGKKGATKYRDLKSEDTGRWGDFQDYNRGPRKDDRDRRDFGRDVDARFRPDRDRDRSGPGGANAIPLGERNERRRARSRSRSRSPRRDRDRERDHRDRDDHSSRRKRDSSREGDRYESEKRRRVDAR